ncbi:hypothetical protein [Actinacidiphila acididurans]|uniref:DUF3618 domain-containing protein n=1 Tax=Actinacidiphila acididurans TaxID=2784346 RepID=A0ABS2TNW1_9ACTN|nr:hypothetical protein [Actinacidiphila acididurans]MBM9504517.1 hypothetical protein [Actinacidiphila acididurans]
MADIETLIRIETKLDLALQQQADHETRIRRLESHGTESHGDRITTLERWRYTLPTCALLSAASIATAVISALR